MDKKTLNNEIILCRAAVRKAKVAVIRKIIKKMKILKSCKVEAVKEKKLKKSERLFKKVQFMKKVKLDDVTKFALRNDNLESFLNAPKVDMRQNALACLAQHDAVVKKVKLIRERFPNWETELPLLLDSLGRKNKKKLGSLKDSSKAKNSSKSSEQSVKKGTDKESVKNKRSPPKEDSKPSKRTHTKQDSDNDNSDESDIDDNGSDKSDNDDIGSDETDNDESGRSEESDSCNLSNASTKVDKIEKIVDPFFIGKKVIAPKLVLESLSHGKNEDKIGQFRKNQKKREVGSSLFHTKPYKSKRDLEKSKPQGFKRAPPEEEKLHPSWAAKKVKLIKPFQGKKIKFSDD